MELSGVLGAHDLKFKCYLISSNIFCRVHANKSLDSYFRCIHVFEVLLAGEQASCMYLRFVFEFSKDAYIADRYDYGLVYENSLRLMLGSSSRVQNRHISQRDANHSAPIWGISNITCCSHWRAENESAEPVHIWRTRTKDFPVAGVTVDPNQTALILLSFLFFSMFWFQFCWALANWSCEPVLGWIQQFP